MYCWYVAIVHIVLAIVLFFVVNWIGDNAKPMGYMQMSVIAQGDTAPVFNYLFKVLTPVVYIILLTALFQGMGLEQFTVKIYLVVVEYWTFRLLFVALMGHIRLLDWVTQIIYWISSIGLALWFQKFKDNVGTILPDPQNLLEELWILIIVFMYSVVNSLEISRERSKKRKCRYICYTYDKLKKKFGAIVYECCDCELEKAMTYSIMIYENFNRPYMARSMERLFFGHSKKIHSYGVMQVQSDHVLTDRESIEKGVAIIREAINQYLLRESEYCSYSSLIWSVAKAYNKNSRDYMDEVDGIFESLKKNYYPSLNESTLNSRRKFLQLFR